MSYDASKVAFCDTETTGLDPERHQVWEVAVIVDGTEHVWQQYLWQPSQAEPDWSGVDPWVLDNTGIRERYDHASAVTWQETALNLRDLVTGRHLVGACPWFDSERLHRIWLRYAGMWRPDEPGAPGRAHPWHYHLIDVETLIVGYVQSEEQGWGLTDDLEPTRLDDVHHDFPWDSEDLSRWVGVEPNDFDRHTALGDARWAKACFEAVMGAPA
jgi:hypothetical protein